MTPRTAPAATTAFFGLGGADTINGLGGNDLIDGGADNDTLTGGSGNDVFVFDAGFGNDTVQDFVDGKDKVDFSTAVFATAEDVVAAAVNDDGDTLISDDFGNTVRLVGFDVNDLDTDDVLLH